MVVSELSVCDSRVSRASGAAAAAGVRREFALKTSPAQSSCPGRKRNFEALCAGPARFGILYEFIRSVLAAANDHTGLYGFGMKSKN